LTKLDLEHLISGNYKIVRHVNRVAILNLIREMQPISRSDLSKLSDLNKSTVSRIVGDLLDERLIHETTVGESTGGRKPIHLRLNRSDHLVGAIDFDPGCSYIAIGDIEANILRKKAIRTQHIDPASFISKCLSELLELMDGRRSGSLNSIGISVPGIVNTRKSEIVVAPDLAWRNVRIDEIVESVNPAKLKGRVIIDNEANTSALAEQWFGEAVSKKSNIVFISEGIGTGIILKGQLIEGSSHLAGQFGHMTINTDGEPCVCGNRGCWELYASNAATVQRFYRLRKERFSGDPNQEIQNVISLARHGDKHAVEAVRETARYLGIGISNIIKGIDPEIIVLGGAITGVWNMIYPEIMQEIESRVFFALRKNVRVVPTSLKERSSLVGAFTLATKEIFKGYKITI